MKNRSAVILLLLANTVSGIAQGISMIAIPWYFAKEEAMSQFGLVYMFTTALAIFWSPYCGTLIDRFDRKHIFLGLTAIVGLLISAIAFLGFSWGMLPWYLVAAVFTLTFLDYNLHYPCVYAFAQEISEPRYYGRMTSYIEVQGQLTTIMAGGGAALLLEGTSAGQGDFFGFPISIPFTIEAWSIQQIFLLDAITYFLAFCIIACIRYVPLRTRTPDTGSVLSQLKIGLQYLNEHRMILLFGVASFSVFAVTLLTNFYLSATYVNKHLLAGGDVYAFSEVCYSIGAVFAGIAIRRLFRWTNIPISITLMTGICTVLLAVLTFTQSIPVFYIMLILLGITNAGIRIQRTTFLFKHVPNQVYGRATSIFFLTNIGWRIVLLGFFSMHFFQVDNNIIYAFGMLSGFLFLTLLVLWRYQADFVRLDEQ